VQICFLSTFRLSNRTSFFETQCTTIKTQTWNFLARFLLSFIFCLNRQSFLLELMQNNNNNNHHHHHHHHHHNHRREIDSVGRHSSRHLCWVSFSFTATQQVLQPSRRQTTRPQSITERRGKTYIFPVAIETAGSWSQQVIQLMQEIGRCISAVTEFVQSPLSRIKRKSTLCQQPKLFQFAELWLTSNLRQLKIPFLTFKCRWHHCWRSATSGHWAKNIYQLEKYFYDRLVMKQQSLLCIFMKTSQS